MDVQQDQAEQFRQFQAGHLERQTKALESIRFVLVFFLIVFCIGFVMALVSVVQAQTS